MTNVHGYNVMTGRCDMSQMLPNVPRGQPLIMLDQKKTIKVLIDQRTVTAGYITPGRDKHGNMSYLAESAVDKEVFTFGTASAADMWLTTHALITA